MSILLLLLLRFLYFLLTACCLLPNFLFIVENFFSLLLTQLRSPFFSLSFLFLLCVMYQISWKFFLWLQRKSASLLLFDAFFRGLNCLNFQKKMPLISILKNPEYLGLEITAHFEMPYKKSP